MRAFYARHCPSKSSDVPRLLAKYVGREQEMINILERKYSARFDPSGAAMGASTGRAAAAAPVPPAGLEERMAMFYHQHAPGKVPSIPHLMQKYSGHEEKLIRMLETKYNAWFPQQQHLSSVGSARTALTGFPGEPEAIDPTRQVTLTLTREKTY